MSLLNFSPNNPDNSDYPESVDLSGGGFALRSPAKLNLWLRVLGKREDGFHELDTLFQEIDWYDELEFRPASDWEFTVEGAEGLEGEENLVCKAAACLSLAAGVPRCGQVHLRKSIPVGGGLGGGSSNGTMALFGLSRLWGLNWPVSRLEPLAASLGSDMNFFLHGGLAHGSGRGEKIEPLKSAYPSSFLVVVPHFGISTSQLFKIAQFPLTDSRKSVIFHSHVCLFDNSDCWLEGLSNDLENIALGQFPELQVLKQQLLAGGAQAAQLSGSGSCMYGVFKDEVIAERAARGFDPRYKWRVCRGISRR